MKEFVSSLSPKGQITLPAEVRKRLGLKPRDKVRIVVDDEGTVRLAVPGYRDLASVRGAAGSLAEPRSWEEVEQIAREDHLKGE
jgi:AbrB family looped-hinge helix DNA binding protein